MATNITLSRSTKFSAYSPFWLQLISKAVSKLSRRSVKQTLSIKSFSCHNGKTPLLNFCIWSKNRPMYCTVSGVSSAKLSNNDSLLFCNSYKNAVHRLSTNAGAGTRCFFVITFLVRFAIFYP